MEQKHPKFTDMDKRGIITVKNIISTFGTAAEFLKSRNCLGGVFVKKRVKLYSEFFYEFAIRYREEKEDQFYFDYYENKIYAHVSFDNTKIFKENSIKMSELPKEVLTRFCMIPYFYVYEDDCLRECLKIRNIDEATVIRYTLDCCPTIREDFSEGEEDAFFRNAFRIYAEDHPYGLFMGDFKWHDLYNKELEEAGQRWLKDNPQVKTRRKIIYEQPPKSLVDGLALAVRPDLDVDEYEYAPVPNEFWVGMIFPKRIWGDPIRDDPHFFD